MSQSGLTSSQISAAGAYAQADRLLASMPVRAIDPTRQRFLVDDQTSASQAPGGNQNAAEAADGDGSSSSQSQARTGFSFGQNGFGLVGAFTSFLARMFGQSEVAQTASASSVKSGIQAYNRAAGTTVAQDGAAEVLPPSFPRLSSGRAVDLVV